MLQEISCVFSLNVHAAPWPPLRGVSINELSWGAVPLRMTEKRTAVSESDLPDTVLPLKLNDPRTTFDPPESGSVSGPAFATLVIRPKDV